MNNNYITRRYATLHRLYTAPQYPDYSYSCRHNYATFTLDYATLPYLTLHYTHDTTAHANATTLSKPHRTTSSNCGSRY